jgi:pimeloyl-ACP methyl ester carboxylesterase
VNPEVYERTIQHGEVALSLRILRPMNKGKGSGPSLLLLHELYGSSDDWGAELDAWPGPVAALDFSGHGGSDWLPGRGYMPEGFAAEADVALGLVSASGPVRLAGAGIGAYVVLLLAAARRDAVSGALLLPGKGLAGAGELPECIDSSHEREWLEAVATKPRAPGQAGPDPLVNRCARDVRPLDYAEAFAREAAPLLVAEMPETPPWLATVLEHAETTATAPTDRADAFRALAALGSS